MESSNDQLEAIKLILENISTKFDEFQSRNDAIYNLLEGVASRKAEEERKISKSGLPYAAIWNSILSRKAQDSTEFITYFYSWQRPPSLSAAWTNKREWHRTGYTLAYPKFTEFLRDGINSSRCSSVVTVFDFDDIYTLNYKAKYLETAEGPEGLWRLIKDRPIEHSRLRKSGARVELSYSTRVFQIMDISPLIIFCILCSLSKYDRGYFVSFIDRYLEFINMGKVAFHRLLLPPVDTTWCSYTFEYHFAFYHVTLKYNDSVPRMSDPRGCRNSSTFGVDSPSGRRYINEESLSFLLIGHLNDVVTCVQLAESYFQIPGRKGFKESLTFRPLNPNQPAANMLLSWLLAALPHVSWRWQQAIDALESEFLSPAKAMFMDNKEGYLAGNPISSFAHAYFWQLQAYSLFEQTLHQTILTWEEFKKESVPKIFNQITQQDVLEELEQGVDQLRTKLEHIKKRTKEVMDLRDGFVSTATLFDSHTSVRQNDNIRLLTYISLLFLPLSFATSIFGMQFTGSGSETVRKFAITLPSIAVATAFITFNLKTILTFWQSTSEAITAWLLGRMAQERRRYLNNLARDLSEDRKAAAEASFWKEPKQTHGWVYLGFLLYWIFVRVPVHEITAALDVYGVFGNNRFTELRQQLEEEHELKDSTQRRRYRVYREAERRKKLQERKEKQVKKKPKRQSWEEEVRQHGSSCGTLIFGLRLISTFILASLMVGFNFLRLFLTPIWATVVVIEYVVLAGIIALGRVVKVFESRGSRSIKLPPPRKTSFWVQPLKILGLDIFRRRRHYKQPGGKFAEGGVSQENP